MPKGALTGLRIIDLSGVRTSAQAAQTLADFGADVIQIEPPGGAELRKQAAWPFWGRGRRSVSLDLKDEGDRDVLLGLVRDADVVIDAFRPGTAEKLGIGADTLTGLNPRLIHASITGFGRDNALSDLPGYEGVVAAKCGVHWTLEGMADREGPSFCTVAYASYAASQLCLQGILAALLEREDSGVGQRVDVSMAQALTVYDPFGYYARVAALRFSDGLKQAARVEDGVPTGGLSFRLLIALTKDGRWLQFSQTPDRLFRAMMKMFGLDWMFDDPEWSSLPDFDDREKRIAFWEKLLEIVRSKTADEWLAEFNRDPDVWGEMFRHDSELLRHPQMVWNKMVAEIDDPERGTVLEPGPLAHLYGTPADVARPAPRPGEYDAELRKEATQSRSPEPVPGKAARTLPLEGITIVELATFYAGPYGATLLTELGARVIKLEEPNGDPMRGMLPFPEIGALKCLYGKESVAVDLGTSEGQEIARKIIGKADVVLQSFRGGVAERLGLDAETMRAINPDLLYYNAPGYGVDGPYARRPAFAPTIGAAAGLAWRNAGAVVPEGDDLGLDQIKAASLQLGTAVMGVGNSDGLSAVSAATVMLLGLVARKRGAGGQEMFTSMISSTAHGLSEAMVEYEGQPAPITADPELYGFGALYRIYRSADGWVFLGVRKDSDWQRLVAALPEGDALRNDPRFASEETRGANDAALADSLGAIFGTRPGADWERDLRAAGVACVVEAEGPIEANYVDDGKLADEMGWRTTIEHAILDEIPRMKPLIGFSRSQTVAKPAGLVGQETQAVLSEWGYSDEDIADLVDRGIVALG